jgi:hypothetical protein
MVSELGMVEGVFAGSPSKHPFETPRASTVTVKVKSKEESSSQLVTLKYRLGHLLFVWQE